MKNDTASTPFPFRDIQPQAFLIIVTENPLASAALGAALVVLLAAVLALTYGNYLGDTAAPHG